MNQQTESLLKYDSPVLVKTTDNKSLKGIPLRASPQQSSASIPPPISPKTALDKSATQENKQILNVILPPREWTEGNQLWVQHVSSAPCTRADVIRLMELLDTKLQQKQAALTGFCPVRRELYAQCFDELIRQVTVNCTERGLLLLRVRDEINLTMAAYQTLYESKVAFGMRAALQSQLENDDMKKKISSMENESKVLEKDLDEQKRKLNANGAREAMLKMLNEKKFNEEIKLLKETNEQLKAKLVQRITSPE